MHLTAVCTECPVTGHALYISDVKPGLLTRDAKGDWGYSTDYRKAAQLTPSQYKAALADMKHVGRRVVFAVSKPAA